MRQVRYGVACHEPTAVPRSPSQRTCGFVLDGHTTSVVPKREHGTERYPCRCVPRRCVERRYQGRDCRVAAGGDFPQSRARCVDVVQVCGRERNRKGRRSRGGDRGPRRLPARRVVPQVEGVGVGGRQLVEDAPYLVHLLDAPELQVEVLLGGHPACLDEKCHLVDAEQVGRGRVVRHGLCCLCRCSGDGGERVLHPERLSLAGDVGTRLVEERGQHRCRPELRRGLVEQVPDLRNRCGEGHGHVGILSAVPGGTRDIMAATPGGCL